MRRRLIDIIPAARFDEEMCEISIEPPTLDQTPGGILLPPGVAEKLTAQAALQEAEALVEALPVQRPSHEVELLAEIERLNQKLETLEHKLTTSEVRIGSKIDRDNDEIRPPRIVYDEGISFMVEPVKTRRNANGKTFINAVAIYPFTRR